MTSVRHFPHSALSRSQTSIVVAAIALLIATGCGKKKEESSGEIIRPVKTFTLGQVPGQRTVELPGETKAIKEAILAFEVNGRISELPVREGDVVKQGQVLAQLDPREMKANLDSATAHRSGSRAKFDRASILKKQGAVSDQDWDSAKREYEVSVAKVDQAQKSFDDTTLKADFEGVVAKIFFKRFENVTAKTSVMVLQDTSAIEVAVNIPESRIAFADPKVSLDTINERAKPMVELTAVPGRKFPARITEVSRTADPATRTYQAKLVFAAPHDLTILPGMTAKVAGELADDGGGTTRLPSNAVGSDPDGKPFVWRLDPKTMKVSKVPVTIGQTSGSMIEVSGELAAGDEIVISGVSQLRPAMKVSRWQGPDSRRP